MLDNKLQAELLEATGSKLVNHNWVCSVGDTVDGVTYLGANLILEFDDRFCIFGRKTLKHIGATRELTARDGSTAVEYGAGTMFTIRARGKDIEQVDAIIKAYIDANAVLAVANIVSNGN